MCGYVRGRGKENMLLNNRSFNNVSKECVEEMDYDNITGVLSTSIF